MKKETKENIEEKKEENKKGGNCENCELECPIIMGVC